MDEAAIIARIREGDESALRAMQTQYGDTCRGIAERILGSRMDAEECLNDALLKVWENAPEANPPSLFAYLAVTVRNLAYDRLRQTNRVKRGGRLMRSALDELAECIPASQNVEQEAEQRELRAAVIRLLEAQPRETRIIFMQRYFAMMPVREIAKAYKINENTVKSTLRRTRERLRIFLNEEGFT